MGGAIFVWVLFAIIWVFISAGLLIATIDFSDPQSLSLPDWYFGFQLLNPLGPYGTLVSLNVGSVAATQGDVPGLSYPSFYTSEVMVLVLIAWLVVPLFLAFWMFKRKDV